MTHNHNFNKKIVKDIALTSLGYVIDCIMGNGDMGYDLSMSASEFEQNFTEDLEEKQFLVTAHRILVISQEYEKLRIKIRSKIWQTYCGKTLENHYQ